MAKLHVLRTSILTSLGVAVACSRKTPPPAPDASAAPVAAPVESVAPAIDEDARAAAAERAHAKTLGLTLGDDGHARRTTAATCDATISGDECPPSASADSACRRSSACGAHSKCVVDRIVSQRAQLAQLGSLLDADAGLLLVSDAAPEVTCHCETSCASDADCKKGEACLCLDDSSGHSKCVAAACRTDADCPSGKCELSEWHDGCGIVASFGCRSAKDKCQTHADCPEQNGHRGQCAFSVADGWHCESASCAIGRPLCIGGVARTANVTSREDWNGSLAEAGDETSAERWVAIGKMEHASIASFAIFTLELLQLGAPADLVRDAQLAALDEIDHARLAFAHASASGVTVGPGPIDMTGVRPRANPYEIAEALVFEGCAGETIGAAEADRDAASACSSRVRETFERIAADETRHAVLAWRALSWLLDEHPAEARRGLESGMRRAHAAYGTDAFRARVLDEVVLPCAEALSCRVGA